MRLFERARAASLSAKLLAVALLAFGIFSVVAMAARIHPVALGTIYALLFLPIAGILLLRLNLDRVVTATLFAGLVLYVAYWTYTGYGERNFDGGAQLQYIEYLAVHKARPPAAHCLICHHPPLYYALGALVHGLMSKTKIAPPSVGLQGLSLILFLILLVYAVRTFTLLTSDLKQIRLATALVVFWPYSIEMTVRVHNDTLASTLMAAALYYVVKWQKEDRPRDLYWASLATALAVLTKSSGYIFVLVIFTLMAARFLRTGNRVGQLKRALVVALLLVAALGLNTVGKGKVNDLAGGERWFCHKVLGNACDFYPGVLVKNDPFNYVYLDLEAFLKEPYMIAEREGSGRQFFWNHLLKSSLFATHNTIPDRETSFELNRRIAGVMNTLLLAMVAYLALGALFVKKHALRPYAVPVLTIASSLLFMVGFRALVPWPHHVDFRHIFPVVIPTALLYAATVAHFRRKELALAPAGTAVAAVFLALSVVYFIPKQEAVTRWTTRVVELSLASRSKIVPEGTPWDKESNLILEGNHILAFSTPAPLRVSEIDVSFDNNDKYVITLHGAGEPRRVDVGPAKKGAKGLARYVEKVRPPVEDVTRIEVRVIHGDMAYSMGHLIVR